MLNSITVSNFKPFGDPGIRVPIRPITLLYGINSAGKSSFLQSLFYLDAVMQRATGEIDRTRLGGDSVELGCFGQLVHKQDLSRRVKFAVEWLNPAQESSWSLSIVKNLEKLVLTLSIGKDDANTAGLVEVEISGRAGSGPEGTILTLKRANLSDDFRVLPGPQHLSLGIRWPDDLELFAKFDMIKSGIISPGKEGETSNTISILLDGLRGQLASWLSSIRYMGPLRHYPTRREMMAFGDQPSEGALDPQGVNAWSLLRSKPSLREEVNEELKLLGSPYQLSTGIFFREQPLRQIKSQLQSKLLDADPKSSDDAIKAIEEWASEERIVDTWVTRNDAIELVISDSSDRAQTLRLAPRDIGMGYSQLLPLLVLARHEANQCVLVEQPELHLHPKLQCELADVIWRSHSHKNHFFIIETHSEHVLLRLMKIIRHSKYPDSQIWNKSIVVWLTTDASRKIIAQEMLLDSAGRGFQRGGWPKGFFDERVAETKL